MKPIERDEILPIGTYESMRQHFRDRVIAEKKQRRVSITPYLSAVFENRDTVMLQIQEMLRTERITSEPAILHEIHTYNDLIPDSDQLSFTLMVEIADREERERMLAELAGLEASIALEVDGELYPAHGKFFGVLEGRTTAVHYLKVDLTKNAADLIRSKRAKVAIVVRHARHPARAELSAATVARLAEDLAS